MKKLDYPCGALIIAGIPGPELDQETLRLIRDYGIENFIIFRRNTSEGKDRLRELCKEIRDACSAAGNPKPVISVDQEGGMVQRLNEPYWKSLPSAQDAGNSPSPETAVRQLANETAGMLKEVGINMNMAPVLDIAGPASDGVLKGRCFGDTATKVAEAGKVYINTLQDAGIATVAKHFPGIGLVCSDPHINRPVVESDPDTFIRQLLPFKEAVATGVSSIMTSHVIFRGIDNEVPATFSHHISEKILRKDLGFKGVLMTDDLEMGGITRYGKVEESALMAFAAGHDMLLICHNQTLIKATAIEIDSACRSGQITTKRLEQSLERIGRLKETFCHQE